LDEPNLGRQRNYRRSTAGPVARIFLTLAALMVLGGLGVSAWLLKDFLGQDSRFRIHGTGNIEATGLTEVSRAQMLPVFGEDIGRNIFFVPLSERRRQLEEIPWIQKATVMRLLPDQIRVSVVERQPVAFTRLGAQVGLVDADGVLLAMPAAMMAQHHYSFPTLSGIDASSPLAARRERMEVYLRLLNELDASGEKLSGQISEVDLTDSEDARVTMEDDPDTLLHFGQDRFLERYRRYKAGIVQWRQKYPKLAAVDLRYDQQVVLQMTPGASVAQAAADEQATASANSEQDKSSTANPGEEALRGTGVKPALTAQAAADAASSGKPPAKVKPVKPAGKAGSKASLKPKTAPRTAFKTSKDKARDKKRAEAKRAALNTSKQKAAPTNRPAASAGMGQ
jgi:cell division protein FtsQ